MAIEKKLSLKKLAKLTGAKILGDENHLISGVNSLEDATSTEVSFLANPRYLELMKESKAGVICIDNSIKKEKKKNFLISNNPSETFQKIAEIIIEEKNKSSFLKKIDPSSIIDPSSNISSSATIFPYVVIDKNVSIGKNTRIYPYSYIGPNTKIGDNCTIYPNVTIREETKIGNNVIIHPGAVIGSCGFGYILDKNQKYQKLKQLGTVKIEDNVEIGANTTIDRARFKKTIIKKNAKIDNLVQIAHNVEIGENNAIAAQTGFSGSSKTGKNVIIGGQVGIAGHLKIEDNVQIAAKSGVSKNLKKGNFRGIPAIPIRSWNRNYVLFKNIQSMKDEINSLKKKIAEILKK